MYFRKAIGLFLLFTLLMQVGGLSIIYQVQQLRLQIKHWNENAESSKLITMNLSIQDFLSSKINEKELYIEGKLYDIKSTKVIDGLVEVKAISDEDEDELLCGIHHLNHHLAHHKNSRFSNFLKLLSLSYIITPLSSNVQNSTIYIIYRKYHLNKHIDFFGDTISPPPDLA